MKPRLRSVEIIRVPARSGGLVTLLRDGERIATRAVEVPPPLDGVLDWLDGETELATIVRRASGMGVQRGEVDALLDLLEETAMLDGPKAKARRARLTAAFAAASTRPAAHAGGSYPGPRDELRRFIRDECLAAAGEEPADAAASSGGALGAPPAPQRSIAGLVAPHMDLYRAAGGYGRSYRALARARSGRERVFFVLGTCHVGMQSAFAMTKKAFATPLGTLEVDGALCDRVRARSGVDVYRDEYKHKGEHSIEFQMVFLANLLGEEGAAAARVVPILCGLGRAQARRMDPREDDEVERVLSVLEDEIARLDGEAVVVAGADLAHIGPRFGDRRALDAAGRSRLEARDRETCRHLLELDAAGFFAHATEDL
ncbi:MAG TPA: AmmeMemoRadiSam system protein B, partial [Polyangiaceae bacterium]|nr:AmmeMemoRadiSam system protein B [Polyangiaceae bacterium]